VGELAVFKPNSSRGHLCDMDGSHDRWHSDDVTSTHQVTGDVSAEPNLHVQSASASAGFKTRTRQIETQRILTLGKIFTICALCPTVKLSTELTPTSESNPSCKCSRLCLLLICKPRGCDGQWEQTFQKPAGSSRTLPEGKLCFETGGTDQVLINNVGNPSVESE